MACVLPDQESVPPPLIISGPYPNRADKSLHAPAESGVEKDRRTTESPADSTLRPPSPAAAFSLAGYGDRLHDRTRAP